jgi:hypothetical protein
VFPHRGLVRGADLGLKVNTVITVLTGVMLTSARQTALLEYEQSLGLRCAEVSDQLSWVLEIEPKFSEL